MGSQSHCPIFLPSFAESPPSIGSLSVRLLSVPSVSSPSATSRRKTAQGRRKKRNNVRAQGENHRHSTTIDILPDHVLLEIFDFYLYRMNHDALRLVWKWHLLVHVCQRWRQIIFTSPRRLNLQILCTWRTPVRKNLGIWPTFPIVIDHGFSEASSRSTCSRGEGNVIAALKHPNRVCYLDLNVTGAQLGKMAKVMQEPYPVLKHLNISSKVGNVPVLPAKFLGGSAPRLQEVYLCGIPFPTLPTFLLSASDLIELDLHDILPTASGYISPEAMVVGLAALPRLKNLTIEFQLVTPRTDPIRPPPVTRTVLPALTDFQFQGAIEYLEDLAVQIDSPQLDRIHIYYLNQPVDFQVTQLPKFIDRSMGPRLTPFKHAGITFSGDRASFDIYCITNPRSILRPSITAISCDGIDWQVSHMAQVLGQFSATLSNVVHLTLEGLEDDGQLEGSDWLHLLHPFSAMQTLHVSQELAAHVALSLEDITGAMITEVLPSLDSICLAGQPASSINKFVAARQLSDRPVTVINTRTAFDERLRSYVSE
ncbi:hypothetical protein EDB89DRAFT_2072154 [Lactarius sanguifluus]|nr:hypothetical protein EDB89DRAFT_2072154 [Lactarius sanguifluus]